MEEHSRFNQRLHSVVPERSCLRCPIVAEAADAAREIQDTTDELVAALMKLPPEEELARVTQLIQDYKEEDFSGLDPAAISRKINEKLGDALNESDGQMERLIGFIGVYTANCPGADFIEGVCRSPLNPDF